MTDYGVLWQKALPDADGAQADDRTSEQRGQFGEGLGSSNVWYGHAHALTWVQPELPEGFVGTTYDASGWCFVEASLSSVLKSSQRRVDIGKFTSASPGYGDNKGLFYPNVPMAIEQCAVGSRPPLRLPSRVAEMLESKTFFARADVATVAGLYRDFFEAVAPWRPALELHHLGWGDAEVAETCQALPSFSRLATLDLSSNRITDVGAGRLALAMRSGHFSALTALCLTENEVGDAGALELVQATQHCPRFERLALGRNRLSYEGVAVLETAWGREAAKGLWTRDSRLYSSF